MTCSIEAGQGLVWRSLRARVGVRYDDYPRGSSMQGWLAEDPMARFKMKRNLKLHFLGLSLPRQSLFSI
jgi:hypothetical protein